MALENLSKVAGRLERDTQEHTPDNTMLHDAHISPSLRFPWPHSHPIPKAKLWPGNETSSLFL